MIRSNDPLQLRVASLQTSGRSSGPILDPDRKVLAFDTVLILLTQADTSLLFLGSL